MRALTFPFTLLFLLILTSHAVSQRIIINSRGERIVMYPDGSWRPAGTGDSVLVKQYLQRAETVPSASIEVDGGSQRNKGEEQEYLYRQWEALYATMLDEEKKVQQDFRLATNAQFKAGEQLQNAESNKKLIEPDHLASLKDEFEISVQSLKKAKLRQKQIEKILAKAGKQREHLTKLNERKLGQMRSVFNLYLAEFNSTRNIAVVPAPSKPVPSTPPQPPAVQIQVPPTSSELKNEKNSPKRVEMIPFQRKPKAYNAQPFACEYIIDTLDLVSGRRRIETPASLIFTHTDPDLRPYFKDKDLITSRGQLSKIGPYIYLNVDFEIASSHSQSNFGSLQNGSLLRFRLLNGEYVSLYNLKSDRGRIDPYSGHTIFSGQYALGKNELKNLSSSGLDKMRVLWGTGYEDYEIYYVDFLSNHIQCLSAKK